MLSRTWLFAPLALAALAAACSGGAAPTASTATATVSSAPVSVAVRLDQILHEGWQKQGLTPAPAADDATFLRRASLDLLGLLPTAASIGSFVADAAPDKRARAIDAMLADPRFSDRFAEVWTNLLLGEPKVKLVVDRAAFRSWLRARVQAGAPWAAIAREIIGAEGRNGPGGTLRERSVAAMSTTVEPEAEGVAGAVNYPLRYRTMVEDLAGKTSRAFLGVQIQCAQCHDHKTESWTVDQFRGFAAAFVKTRAIPADGRDKGGMRLFDVRDVPRARLGGKAPDSAKAIAKVAARALDGTLLDAEHPRKALASWITAPQNPTFAKAFVNRAWAGLLGVGFVDPVDDLRPGNPAELPEAFELLAGDFVAGGFDIRRLLRTIALSDAYARAAGADTRLWSSFALTPVPAEVLLDAVVEATGLGELVEEIAGERADLLRARTRQRFVLVLDVDEDAGTHSFEGSVVQALLLSNGVVTRVGASAVAGGALEAILHGPGDDDARLDALYLRTLSRKPDAAERARWKAFLDAAGNGPAAPVAAVTPSGGKADPLAKVVKRLKSKAKNAREQAWEDLFWTLLNASEMAFRH